MTHYSYLWAAPTTTDLFAHPLGPSRWSKHTHTRKNTQFKKTNKKQIGGPPSLDPLLIAELLRTRLPPLQFSFVTHSAMMTSDRCWYLRGLNFDLNFCRQRLRMGKRRMFSRFEPRFVLSCSSRKVMRTKCCCRPGRGRLDLSSDIQRLKTQRTCDLICEKQWASIWAWDQVLVGKLKSTEI